MSFWKWGFVICVFIAVCDADSVSDQEMDLVSNLPGQNFNVDFAQYAGYATQDPASKPLVLWLNGDADWSEDLDIVDVDKIQNGDISMVLEDEEAHEDNESGGWDLEDLELPPDVDTPRTDPTSRTTFVAPTAGNWE